MFTVDRKRYIKDLSELVGFRTVTSQPNGFAEAFSFIQDHLHHDATISVIENNGEKTLIAANTESKKPDFCYLAHLDVVSGETKQFKMIVENDIAMGRGVSDMKFAIPIGYHLLNYLIETKSDISFALVVTTDEERGGFNGAQHVADIYEFHPRGLIVPDGGDNYECIHKCKGVCHLKVISQGLPAHASRPWDGKNAIDPLIFLANKLVKQYRRSNSVEAWKTTLNIGLIQGGTMINQVASQAEMHLDIRFVPETDTLDNLFRMVEHYAHDIDSTLVVKLIASGESFFVPTNDPLLKIFLEELRRAAKRPIPIKGAHGSTDARHFAKHGAIVLMSKPESGGEHGDQEWINIDSALGFAEMLGSFLQTYALRGR